MKISDELKDRISQWISSTRDHNQGLLLLQQCSRNKTLIRNLSKPSGKNTRKIAWQLRKLAGLPEEILVIVSKNPSKEKASGSGQQIPADKKACKKCGKYIPKYPLNKTLCDKCNFEAEVETYPEIIQEIIREKGKLHIDRDIAHKDLSAIPDENSAKNIAARKDLRDKIHDLSARIEFLNGHFRAFRKDNTVVPDRELIYPDPEPEKPSAKIDDPRKRLTNLRAQRTKKNNQLEFQSNKKMDEPNPMPPGEKRTKLEEDLLKIYAEILALEKQLNA